MSFEELLFQLSCRKQSKVSTAWCTDTSSFLYACGKPWCCVTPLVLCCVPEGFPDYHSHKLSCSITYSLWVINVTDWALKKLCNGDHRAQETRTCFPGIIGENSVVCRRQLRRQGALENPDDFWIHQILSFTVSESSKPFELGEFFTKCPYFLIIAFISTPVGLSLADMLDKKCQHLWQGAGKHHGAEPINNQ